MQFIRDFGFLSENSRFAELCEQCNITFIGPPSTVIASLGNKQAAKNTMANAGVPIIPGGKNPIYTVEEGMKEAETIGYPVIIKAALGGGGKGMRVADTPADFEESFPYRTERNADGFWRFYDVRGAFCTSSKTY